MGDLSSRQPAADANLTAPGPGRLIALGKGRAQSRAAAHKPAQGLPDADATARQAMNHRLRTDDGRALYKRRGATVEPAIGNLKKILDRFSCRGLNAAIGELHLAATAHNLLKTSAQPLPDSSPRRHHPARTTGPEPLPAQQAFSQSATGSSRSRSAS
jgi:hypothetical protein